jgi:integration host factor subunit beta
MLKSDLVRRVQAQNPLLLPREVETIVGAIFDEITATMARGDRVELRGFGTFSVKVREARTGRNPMTGVLVPVPKKVHPYFKPGKEMKERLNRKASS